MGPGFIFLGIVVVVGVLLISHLFEQKRRRILADFAARHGLRFVPGRVRDHAIESMGFALMGRGHTRRVRNMVTGHLHGREVTLCEYRYTTGSGKNQSTHTFTCGAWQLPVPLGHTAIRPEGLFDRVAEWFGQNDIDFESSEFSRRYHVNGDDRREVYAVLHPRMMEFIMASDVRHLEIIGRTAMVHRDEGSLTPGLCDWFLDLGKGFDALLPEHLVRAKSG